MHKLKIATKYDDTVEKLLRYHELVEGDIKTGALETPLTLLIDYPDDLLSQSLTFWLAMAQGCGLIDWYEFRGMRS